MCQKKRKKNKLKGITHTECFTFHNPYFLGLFIPCRLFKAQVSVGGWGSAMNISVIRRGGPQWSNPPTELSWLLALTPYPLICLTDLWGAFPPILLACFPFLCSFSVVGLTLLAAPASLVEFSLTDPFSPSFLWSAFSGFPSRWLKLCAGVCAASERFLHLLKGQFTPTAAPSDTMTDVHFNRKTEL